MKLTQEYVKEQYDYKNGQLFWKKSGSGRIRPTVGCTHKRDGYLLTRVCGKQYPVHRLIWLWHYGYLPENEMDHINRNRSDNRIKNLREVSVMCNQRNTGNWKTNNSGIKGVWFEIGTKRWRAGVRVMGKQNTLGSYKEKYEAVLARLTAELCLNWPGCDSSSPAYRYAKKKRLIHF